MSAETSAIEKMLQEVQVLSEKDRIRPIGRIAETVSHDLGRVQRFSPLQ